MQKLATVGDKEKLACLMDQEQTVGQTFKTDAVVKNQNFILIEDENVEFEELDLIARSNQEGEGQLLKIVKE